jgi:hypothetical protein
MVGIGFKPNNTWKFGQTHPYQSILIVTQTHNNLFTTITINLINQSITPQPKYT